MNKKKQKKLEFVGGKNVDQSWMGPMVIHVIIICIAIAAGICALASCSTIRYVDREVVIHDTTRVVKVDSIWNYQHDSVFVKEKGDTVYKYVEHIRYRDRIKVDTLLKVRVDSVTVESIKEVQVAQPLTWWQKFRQGAFLPLLLAVVLLLLWTFRKLF